MNLERLNIQIDVLRRVEKTALLFDMGAWLSHVGECGSVACAFGYAALDPRLQAEGLTMQFSYRKDDGERVAYIRVESIGHYNTMLKALSKEEAATLSVYPVFGGLNSFIAAIEFYDITSEAAHYLFDPDFYQMPVDPHEVIERVETVIKHHGDAPDDWRRDEGRDDEDDC